MDLGSGPIAQLEGEARRNPIRTQESYIALVGLSILSNGVTAFTREPAGRCGSASFDVVSADIRLLRSRPPPHRVVRVRCIGRRSKVRWPASCSHEHRKKVGLEWKFYVRSLHWLYWPSSRCVSGLTVANDRLTAGSQVAKNPRRPRKSPLPGTAPISSRTARRCDNSALTGFVSAIVAQPLGKFRMPSRRSSRRSRSCCSPRAYCWPFARPPRACCWLCCSVCALTVAFGHLWLAPTVRAQKVEEYATRRVRPDLS
jgi:hypothetical protein